MSGRLACMDRAFTVEAARQLMPTVLARAEAVIEVRANLVELQAALSAGVASPRGGLPEAKAYQAQLSELIGWFSSEGIELKGIAPLLLDFPSELDGEPVLLCWLEGEQYLGWYHKLAHGFAGRRRLD
jgi:hypothetical protein